MTSSSTEEPECEILSTDNIYICSKCECHLSAQQYQISDQFQGKFGAGYLMDKLMNVDLMAPKDILLVSGKQTTSDAVCKRCHSYVGWKYLETDNENNVFKINKFVLEKGRMKTIDFYKED